MRKKKEADRISVATCFMVSSIKDTVGPNHGLRQAKVIILLFNRICVILPAHQSLLAKNTRDRTELKLIRLLGNKSQPIQVTQINCGLFGFLLLPDQCTLLKGK